jgi:hypothetical protein
MMRVACRARVQRRPHILFVIMHFGPRMRTTAFSRMCEWAPAVMCREYFTYPLQHLKVGSLCCVAVARVLDGR